MMKSSKFALRIVLSRVGEPSLTHYGAARTPLDGPEASFGFWREVVEADPTYEPDKEHLIAVLLDTKLRPKGYHVVSVGSLNESLAHPREIFRAAIIAAAYGVVVIHNHPSGDPTPSQADHRLTHRIRDAAELLTINFLDHLVAGNAEGGRQPYYSFRESGTL